MMRSIKSPWPAVIGAAIVSLECLFLAGCGGGSDSSPPPAMAAPSGLSYTSPQTLTVGQAVMALTPTVTGTVSNYAVSPALPAGLSLNTTSGAISGTPTTVTAQAKYTVTASNSSGSTATDVMITVNDAKPAAVIYPGATVALATGVAITKMVPSSATGGGAVVSWSIAPDLPAGLTFSTTDGSISGTPTADSAATAYTITATNTGGQVTVGLTLSVATGVLLDLGHVDAMSVLRFDGTHVLSVDQRSHWLLSNFSSGAAIASGDAGCTMQGKGVTAPDGCLGLPLADMGGTSFAVLTPTGFEVRSMTDGHLLSRISTAALTGTTRLSFWALSTDGSYVVAGGAGLQAWKTADGTTLFTKTGDYSSGHVFAAPTEARVAGGAAGANVIETLAVPAGTSSVSPPFNGTFATWAVDGDRFFTKQSNLVLTYSSAAVQQDTTLVDGGTFVAATGAWFASFDSNVVYIYKVGNSLNPAAFFSSSSAYTVLSSANTFAVLSPGHASIVDVSGGAPVTVDHAVAVQNVTTYAATSATQWVAGNQFGVVFDGSQLPAPPQYFSWGPALSIVGNSKQIAVATAAGEIFRYDGSTLAPTGRIPQFSSQLSLSADGTNLAALGDTLGVGDGVTTLNVWDLTTQTNFTNVSGTASVHPTYAALSPSGTVLGVTNSDGTHRTYGIPVAAPTWSDTTVTGLAASPLFLSSDGSLIAEPLMTIPNQVAGSSIVKNGTLVTAVNGVAAGWIDDNHLLVNNFKPGHVYIPPPTSSAQVKVGVKLIYQDPEYTGASIFDATGKLLSSAPLPEIDLFQPLAADSIYSPQRNSIVSPTTGAVSWTSADDSSAGEGAVAATVVVFQSGAQVLALPR